MFDESIINIINRVLYDPFRETILTLKNQLTIDYSKNCGDKNIHSFHSLNIHSLKD